MAWGTKSRQSRGYGAAWERIRKVVLARDCGLCQVCIAKSVYTPANIVDHKTSKAVAAKLGWSQARIDDPLNLQTICEPCHLIKNQEEQGKTYRPKVQVGLDGWPVEG